MKINKCPVCGSPAAIRYRNVIKERNFRVWIECHKCGRRTREFLYNQTPTETSTGGRFAVITWNSTAQEVKQA